MALLRAACAIGMALLCSGAYAEEHKITIHHMDIDKIEGTIRAGDTLIFENQSDMAHNLYLTYADGSIDSLDTQVPGTQRTLKVRMAGPAMIRCWIHPIIKAEMNIEPQEETK